MTGVSCPALAGRCPDIDAGPDRFPDITARWAGVIRGCCGHVRAFRGHVVRKSGPLRIGEVGRPVGAVRAALGPWWAKSRRVVRSVPRGPLGRPRSSSSCSSGAGVVGLRPLVVEVADVLRTAAAAVRGSGTGGLALASCAPDEGVLAVEAGARLALTAAPHRRVARPDGPHVWGVHGDDGACGDGRVQAFPAPVYDGPVRAVSEGS